MPVEYNTKIHETITEIGRATWSALESPDFPFADYDFLAALESSGSLGERTGWFPLYLAVRSGDDKLQGVIWLYLKTNSYGEYIFDWDWARAYEENGVAYYPKLVSAIPFTPATGPNFLVAPGVDRETMAPLLIRQALSLYQQSQASSFHALFVPQKDCALWLDQGLTLRHSFQYHWHNNGYGSFDGFLEQLKGKRRRQINRERQSLQGMDATIHIATGSDLTPAHADAAWSFYENTTQEKYAIPYLTRAFFEEIFTTMADRILFIYAARDGRILAGSLFLHKGAHLYGRYWGFREDIRNLHFEICYYKPMEFAIDQKIELFEAGAQGAHKLQRGFLPNLTYSAHQIRHQAFQKAIDRFIRMEQRQTQHRINDELEHSPFRDPSGNHQSRC